MAAFREWMKRQHYSPRTVALYSRYVFRAIDGLFPIPMTRAEPRDLADWISTFPSAASQRQAHAALVAYYRYAEVDPSPMRKVEKAPEPVRLPRPLLDEDFDAYRRASLVLGGEWAAFGMLLCTTGCRITEVRTAEWANIDLRGGRWQIIGKGSGRRGPRPRIAYLRADVRNVLRRWVLECPSREWLLPSPQRTSRPMSDRTLRERHGDILAEAGLPADITPHRFRHTVATIALERTLDFRAVQELMGHANMATTQLYTKVSAERLAAVVEALPA